MGPVRSAIHLDVSNSAVTFNDCLTMQVADMIRCNWIGLQSRQLAGQLLQWNRTILAGRYRSFATTPINRDAPKTFKGTQVDVDELLSKPTWSVASLLQSTSEAQKSPQITSKQLHHLLRLSALPPPKTAAEEEKMLASLSSHLHFVNEIQKVDTTGVEPLRSLRDETAAGQREAELGLDALKEALQKEEIRGTHHKRIRRVKEEDVQKKKEAWDPFAIAEKKVGRFFVVEGGKEG